MPKLKQPNPLQEKAFGILVNHVVNNCNRISVLGEVNLLKKNIAALKEHLHQNLPQILLLKFCKQFLSRFAAFAWRRWDDRRPIDHDWIVLKILLDLEIIGLKLTDQLVQDIEPFYVDGLLESQVLNMSAFIVPNLTVFEDFRLGNLTKLIISSCDDDNLKIIGSHCAKLQVLEIILSENVTDEGMRALNSCTELRSIDFCGCIIRNSRINDILSIHKKLEEFRTVNSYSESDESFDVLTRERTLVCPSLKKFLIKLKGNTLLTYEHLSAVVELFPNLSDLEIASDIKGDILHVLKGMKKLTGLVFKYPVRHDNLEQLLMDIGQNITKLSISSPSPRLNEKDLKTVYKHCSNIEFLTFKSIKYGDWQEEDKLVIPPFRKLKNLHCHGPLTCKLTDNILALEITELPEIETLTCEHISSRGAVRMVDSIMFDHIKYPNLKLVHTCCLLKKDENRINKFAKNNNLDFKFV